MSARFFAETSVFFRLVDTLGAYLVERVEIPWAFQVSLQGTKDRLIPDMGKHGVRCVPATRFLANLP